MAAQTKSETVQSHSWSKERSSRQLLVQGFPFAARCFAAKSGYYVSQLCCFATKLGPSEVFFPIWMPLGPHAMEPNTCVQLASTTHAHAFTPGNSSFGFDTTQSALWSLCATVNPHTHGCDRSSTFPESQHRIARQLCAL